MAKAHVATLEGNYSDIVLGRVVAFGDTGWNFKEVDMTFIASDADADSKTALFAGMLVGEDGTPATAAADVFGVLVDRKVLPGVDHYIGVFEPGEKVPMVLAVRGLTLNQLKLKYADGSDIDAAGIKALEAQGNQVTDKIVGTQFIGSVL
ncbi:head decoration [Cronobacter phage CR3]|uniref:Putative head stabilization/decoration protein n=3 Tax=Certrevirus TaxID=1914850 RepID=I1TR47_9CAUD|nr:head decoration [Cronobacter phage CR3]YP_009042242.1 head decoration [Cronobacter phage CR8]YP_009188973.1 head decoration [Cronobacter phage PBES 02]ATS93405.1 putative head stabilization/decoration protein [Pectobacterium phage DU_PP_I]ATS93721.1 putative head stabilization/decoration protein [Pectobacterium phage DU_PP_IV]QQG33311.1 head decoration protein [Pectobacterium phage PcCB7V]UTC25195.1 head stabilization/decoration protein [Pectobacterium phage vB_PcaM_P7_Pc]AFH21170.1 putat